MNFKERLKKVKLLVFDIDGVLTDGTLSVMPGGELVRKMNIKDGYALQHAVNQGVIIGIISGGTSGLVEARLRSLGIQNIYMTCRDKKDAISELIHIYDLQPEEILYMGDDMPDFEVMNFVGVPCCPMDAAPEIREISVYVSPFAGGQGCARDIIRQVMKLNDLW
jgi:3-deoxy-D-manno-octulosonate 8-phosphate phosphatase (KDO 8-P phosphatase)